MTYTPRIAWQKWHPWNNQEDDRYEEIEDFAEENEGVNVGLVNGQHVVTPFGLIPINQLNPLMEFNFWTGHSNFNISKIICRIINQTEGVEAFIVQSPYRFKIAIGKCFSPKEVTNRVAYNIGQLFQDISMDTENAEEVEEYNEPVE